MIEISIHFLLRNIQDSSNIGFKNCRPENRTNGANPKSLMSREETKNKSNDKNVCKAQSCRFQQMESSF